MPTGNAPLILKYQDWPAADRAAWDALFIRGDIIDGTGPCTHWAAGSRRKRLQSYGHWLGYLARIGRLRTIDQATEQATRSLVCDFLEEERRRCSLRTTYMHAEDLWFVLNAMSPSRNWDWLRQIVLRLRACCDIGQLKPHAGVSASDIYKWAHKSLQAVEAIDHPPDIDCAVRFRDGLLVGLLIAIPLRVRTFTAIEIGRHLVAHGGGFLLQFAPEDIKDKKKHEYPLPKALTVPMLRYIETYRPILLQGARSQRLWISRRGAPLGIDSLTGHLADLTDREFGEVLRPHAFRHIAATTIALEDPDHVGIIADVLGHATLAMSEKHYNHATGVRAIINHQHLVQSLKEEAKRREREQNRQDRYRQEASRRRKRVRDRAPSEVR